MFKQIKSVSLYTCYWASRKEIFTTRSNQSERGKIKKVKMHL